MSNMTIDRSELRQIIRETVAAALIDNKDFLEDAVSEAILDLNLGIAIEEGDVGEYVSENVIWGKLVD